MIDSNPLMKLLEDRKMSLKQLSSITGLSLTDVKLFTQGKSMTQEKIDILCSRLNCQPCDLIAYRKHLTSGYWVYITQD